MFSSAKLLAFAACAQSALAAIYITSPVASSTWTAGQQQTISWQDDGKAPTAHDFGPALVTIDVGNAIQQTPLQTVVDNVNTATTSSIVFTPNANIGANGGMYFIRIQSVGLMDPAQPQYPALAFSAKFTMTGMNGQFNATVQQQIDGATTAPIGGPAPTNTPASPPSSTPSKPSTTSSQSGSATPTPAQGNVKDNGALGLVASGAVAVAGSIFAAAMLL